MGAKDEEIGLKRRKYYPNLHADPCAYGRVVNLYIFYKRKWRKIGEYCQGCGAVAILPEFKKGLDYRARKLLEMRGHGPKTRV